MELDERSWLMSVSTHDSEKYGRAAALAQSVQQQRSGQAHISTVFASSGSALSSTRWTILRRRQRCQTREQTHLR